MFDLQKKVEGRTKNFEPSNTFNGFGCSCNNQAGLKLKFEVSENDDVFSSVQIGSLYESFPGIIHGGVVATVLDEIMAQAAYLCRSQPSMTIGMRIRYLQAMCTNNLYRASAKVISEPDSVATEVEGRLCNSANGEIIALATGTFISLSPGALSKNSRLPDMTVRALSFLS